MGRAKAGEVVEFTAAQLVLATEADAAAKLLARSAPETAQVLGEFRYAPVALVQWAEKTAGESRLPKGFGYLSAPVERLFAMGTLFVGDLLDETPRRFSTFVGGALAPEKAAMTDEELVRGAEADLQKLTGGAIGEVCQVIRWPRAVFQPAVGHFGQLERLRKVMPANVALAGSYFGGAAMKDAIVSGFDAVRTLTPTLSPAGEREGLKSEVRA
jgi:protoporphyrinogen oxidase